MSTYTRKSHFREKYIRKIVGSSMVADLSVTFDGIWNRTKLESLIDGTIYGEHTGRYRHMCNGRLPHDSTCKKILDGLTKLNICNYNIRKWKDLPYWRLLYRLKPDLHDIENVLFSIKSEIKKYIWVNPSNTTHLDFLFNRKKITPELIANIAHYENFEALMTLTAFAIEARTNQRELILEQCVMQTRKIFARVICTTPQLYIRWPILLQYYIEPIWYIEPNLPYKIRNSPYKILNMAALESEILEEEKNALSQGVQLPSKHHFRQINKKELYLIEDAFK